MSFLFLLSCNGGVLHSDDAREEDETEGFEGPAEDGGFDQPDETVEEGDIFDAAGDEAGDWVRYDGEVPEIAVFEKEDHITSCMRTRACSPENPQQMATCTSAYAHIVGREVGITLQWVAQCVNGAPLECGAIRACMGNGSEPEACVPLETPDRCEGSVLFQCSRASALTFVFDCAHVGMGCTIDYEGYARCGLGECDAGSFRPGCFGDILVFCEKGVIVVADCTAAGLACAESDEDPGRCAGSGESCDEEVIGRACDGDILTGCLGGRMGSVDCPEVIDGWTCGPTEGTFGCVPPGGECWAYPLIGSSIEEDCDGDNIITCLDGIITQVACADYGLEPCIDLGTAARCAIP